jgi:thiamine-phosphate pyrophosphorylase
MTPSPLGRLHVLTDTTRQERFSHAELARRALRGGASVVQFRQKSSPIRAKLRAARAVAHVCAEAGAPLVVNDHLDVAQAVGAAGVHLGQDDFPVATARRVLGPDALIGATATTPDQARAATDDGADYVGFGPVFSTNSKANPASVKGVEGLRAACRAVDRPVIAIAGVTPERVGPCLKAGAHGVAVLSGVACAEEPARAARRYRTALDEALAARS